MKNKYQQKYLKYILYVLVSTFLLIAFSLYYIIQNTFVENDIIDKAIAWQSENKGVIAVSNEKSNIYKQRFTEFILKKDNNIEGLVLGASTLMTLQDKVFKKATIYNATKDGNPLYDSISKAKFYTKNNPSIKYIIIGFDLLIAKDLSKYKNDNYTPKLEEMSLYKKIQDAISYQRVKIVVSNLYDKLFNSVKTYRCPKDNIIGTDQFFNPPKTKMCYGYRYDGSSPFKSFSKRLTKKQWENYFKKGFVNYRNNIKAFRGQIALEYLKDLEEVDKLLKSRGGKLIIIIPPIIPKGVSYILNTDEGKYLKKAISDLSNFSQKLNIVLIDASKSEKFNCNYNDFIDSHHALTTCYQKIFKKVIF